MSTDIVLEEKVIDTTNEEVFSYKLWKKVSDIPIDWDRLVATKDLFLSLRYLYTLEKTTPKGMKLYFVGFYKEKRLIGTALFQTTRIKASEAYRPKFSKGKGFLFSIDKFFKTTIPKLFNLDVLVGGNLMLTGEHSYYFDSSLISEKEVLNLWYKAICDFKRTEFKPNLTLLKDFFEYKKYDFEALKNDENHSYYVEPNMILHLNSEWNSLTDYAAVMKKKYRARVTTARKKIIALEKKSLSYSEIVKYKTTLFKLYKSVSDNASFNTFILNENYFEEMKRNLNEEFRLVAYFLEGEIVGFFTVILDQNRVVTHFLGYCPKCNKEYQLYFNMLLDMVEIGIEEKMNDIIYARTALEIKSSLGAVPYQMEGFMKYENPVLNKAIFSIFKFIKPKDNWIQRHPFKKN
ncbi:hypothetical protein UJ101_00198 [Flavobacteriaceae bacterium UJ101]|nr:hypothetical protein UJ101_00198 [Flavobacteriaceae bacterium UJ101]